MPSFPSYRPRRLRRTEALRSLVRETVLASSQLVLPLFVRAGNGVRMPMSSMAGVSQTSVDELVRDATAAAELGVGGVLLFGIPEHKDATGSSAWDDEGPVQRAVRALKRELPHLVVITDVCMCEYTSHGHCGVLVDGEVDNDRTLELLAREALSHARAGADIVAPSDMMDGRVGAIRSALDEAGHVNTPVMAYAAKFASAFYGPLREVALDVAEGADLIMVKPALAYLDLVWRVREQFGLPVVAYSVSGEYAMV